MSKPTPKFKPIPPRDFLDDTDTPMMVSIMTANGIPNLLYLSVV